MIANAPQTLDGWRAEELVDDALALGGPERLDAALALMGPDDGPGVRTLLPAAALGARAGVVESREQPDDGQDYGA